MFGRHLRPEYKAGEYKLVDTDHRIIGTRHTCLRDPVVVIAGASGFLVILLVFVTDTVLPFFNVIVSETTSPSILLLVGLAGAVWGYYIVTEPDTEEKI